MRKIIMLSIFALAAVIMVSCKEGKKEHKKDHDHEMNHDQHEMKNDGKTAIYQCPMDCEKGKTYNEPGKCPVCNMALKPVDSDQTAKQACGNENCVCEDCAQEKADGKTCSCGACASA